MSVMPSRFESCSGRRSLISSRLTRIVRVALAILAAGLALPVDAQEIRLETATSAEPIVVRRILSLDETALKVRAGDQDRSIPRDDLIALTLPSAPSRDLRGNDLLSLTSGDRLRVDKVTSANDALVATLRASSAVQLTIPLEYTRGLIRLPKGVSGWIERLPTSDDPSVDVALLQNSDRIRGEFLSLSDEKLTLKTAAGETSIEPEDLRAIAFCPDLLAKRPIPARHTVVQFRDGSFWTADSVTRAAGESHWYVTVGADRWTIPDDAVVRIAFYSGSAPSLTSIIPVEHRTIPFLPDVPQAKAGREPSESPDLMGDLPTVGGTPVPRALNGSGRTEWTYSLEGEWTSFRAAAEIPDSAGEGGSAVFRIDIDGKRVFESGLRRAGGGTLPIPPVSLTGAKTLRLTIDYGEFWDVRNRGVWIDPRLVRLAGPGKG